MVSSTCGKFHASILTEYSRKTESDVKKRRSTFEEAQAMLYDPNAIVITDPDYSVTENRFSMLGLGSKVSLWLYATAREKAINVFEVSQPRKPTRK